MAPFVLCMAANAGKQMPVLKAMELFQIDTNSGLPFQYTSHKNRGPADMGWQSTREYNFSHSVLLLWAQTHLNSKISLVVKMIGKAMLHAEFLVLTDVDCTDVEVRD